MATSFTDHSSKGPKDAQLAVPQAGPIQTENKDPSGVEETVLRRLGKINCLIQYHHRQVRRPIPVELWPFTKFW